MKDNKPYNSAVVLETLTTVVDILNRHSIQYRFIGSIIPAALNNSLHRKINDLDLLVEIEKVDILIAELRKHGFEKKIKNHLRFSELLNLYIFHGGNLLETSFFGVHFHANGSISLNTKYFSAEIPNNVVKQVHYNLLNTEFIGIPASVVYKTILFSKNNPKRNPEIEIFNKLNIQPYKGTLYTFRFLGISISWLPRAINYFLEIIGVIRTRIGFNYDIWK